MFDYTSTSQSWERQTMQNVLVEHLKEQRRARRWGIFFRLVTIVLLLAVVGGIYQKDRSQHAIPTREHTALIDIYGAIDAGEDANADNIRASLRSAFQSKHAKGVILRINSPGGSPVQARQIYNEIRGLKKEYPETKVYAVIEDIGTSAAYLIACAADEIYADETSLVGSIGAKMEGFGFVDLLQKIGVERRTYVSGKYKDVLDPFAPVDPEAKAFVLAQIKSTHDAFIGNVREGRGKRLKETELLFSGLFWSGQQALTLGLIDGFADAQHVAKELIHAKDLIDYSPGMNFLDKIARRVGATMVSLLAAQQGVR